jgi:hypothetical protein
MIGERSGGQYAAAMYWRLPEHRANVVVAQVMTFPLA